MTTRAWADGPGNDPNVKAPAVIANPTKLTPDLRESIEGALAQSGANNPAWFETTEDDPGVGQAKEAVADGADLILAAGGDGTVRACAAALCGTDVPLALLPTGTGNLLATNLQLPDSVPEAVEVAFSGHRRRIDVLELDGEVFVVMGGCGFDASMFENTSDSWKDKVGWAAYLTAGVRTLQDAKPQRLEVVVDDNLQRHRASGVVVANVGELTGGVALLPGAVPDDGLLDLAILTAPRLWDWLALGARLLTRQNPRHQQMRSETAKTVVVRWPIDMPTEIDGDVIEPRSSAEFCVRPAALTVCVPAD